MTTVSGILALISVFITNDVALITFVPFVIFILEMAGLKKYMIPILSLQTIAAHMGSSLSPIGNPHNLYLYGLSGLSAPDFIWYMLPYFLLAGALLIIAVLFIFVGNMGRIEVIQNFLEHIVEGNEVITSVLASQIISNVPASILLPNFSDKYIVQFTIINVAFLIPMVAFALIFQ